VRSRRFFDHASGSSAGAAEFHLRPSSTRREDLAFMKRLLIVDDDPDILQGLVMVLEDNYEITTAQDGIEALRLVEAGSFDAVILDLMMPLLDGASFIHELEAQRRSLPVIIVSAHTNVAAQAHELKARDYLAKPFRVETLEKKLERLFRGASEPPPAGGAPAGDSGTKDPGSSPAGALPGGSQQRSRARRPMWLPRPALELSRTARGWLRAGRSSAM
jgi:DNA-binding response OmpR family regulator